VGSLNPPLYLGRQDWWEEVESKSSLGWQRMNLGWRLTLGHHKVRRQSGAGSVRTVLSMVKPMQPSVSNPPPNVSGSVCPSQEREESGEQ